MWLESGSCRALQQVAEVSDIGLCILNNIFSPADLFETAERLHQSLLHAIHLRTGVSRKGSKEEISLTSSTKCAAGADHRVECGYNLFRDRDLQQVAAVSGSMNGWMDGWMDG